MKLYVASKFENHPKVRRWVTSLRAHGYTITHDWTDTDEFENGQPKPGVNSPEMKAEEGQKYAEWDREGVRNCDVLIWLADMGGNGAQWEAGMAAGANKPVIVVDPTTFVVFFALPNVEVIESHGDWNALGLVLARLSEMASATLESDASLPSTPSPIGTVQLSSPVLDQPRHFDPDHREVLRHYADAQRGRTSR